MDLISKLKIGPKLDIWFLNVEECFCQLGLANIASKVVPLVHIFFEHLAFGPLDFRFFLDSLSNTPMVPNFSVSTNAIARLWSSFGLGP